MGTVPAPVPAPFGLAPRARIDGTDLAFGPVRHFTARPQSACGASAPLPRPDLLTTRSEPYRPVLESPRPPPVFQSRGTYQVPSMADLDLAGHVVSTPGLLQLRGVSSGMNQCLMPQNGGSCTSGGRCTLRPSGACTTSAGRDVRQYAVEPASSRVGGNPSAVAGGSCVGGLCKPCCGANSGF